MDDKQLFSQLHSLKDKVRPDREWQKRNRALLLTQISASLPESDTVRNDRVEPKRTILPFALAKKINQPALAVVFIVVIVVGGCVTGLLAAQDTKPGDSLYIAKIISEKVQLALTFNSKKKAQLGLEFAGNRVKELDQVLAEQDNSQAKDQTVQQLVNNFQQEISNVKSNLEKINSETQSATPAETPAQSLAEAPKSSSRPAASTAKPGANTTSTPSEVARGDNGTSSQVFSADIGKENQGISVSEPGSTANSSPQTSTSGTSGVTVATNTATTTAVTGVAGTTVSGDTGSTTATSDPQAILQEAENLLNRNDYSGTISKLNQASQAIGQVKGAEAAATSTTPAIGTSTDENIENSATGTTATGSGTTTGSNDSNTTDSTSE